MKLIHLFIYISSVLMMCCGASCSTSRKAAITSTQPPREELREYKDFLSHLPKERRKLVEEASTWLGTPYLYAGQEKGVGADCSGFVMEVYQQALDCAIPRNSAKQAKFCRRIKKDEVTAGDLVFFATGKDPKRISHVGIVIENDEFIHASSSKGVVVSKLTNPWYAKRLLMYGRVPVLD